MFLKAAKYMRGGLPVPYLESIPVTEAIKKCEIVKKIYDEERAEADRK